MGYMSDRLRALISAASAKCAVPLSASVSLNLDAARWIAAGFVVLYHLGINVLVDPETNPASYAGIGGQIVYLLSMAGPRAVMWFFVISGYLVGGSVITQINRKSFKFSNFAIHRATRLYVVLIPALLAGVTLDLLRIAAFGISTAPAAGGETAASYTIKTFAGNLAFLQTLVTPTLGSNNPLWSLANEAWYYAVFPLLLAPFLPKKSIILRSVLFVLALVIIVAGFHANRTMVMLSSAWLIGAFARLAPFRLMSSLPFAWLIAGVVTLALPLIKGGHLLLLNDIPPLALANVLVTAAHDKRVPSRVAAQCNTALAGFSFSVYLVHAPMLHFLLTRLHGQSNPRLDLPISWNALAIGGALFAAIYFYAWGFSLLTERHTEAIRDWVVNRVDTIRLSYLTSGR